MAPESLKSLHKADSGIPTLRTGKQEVRPPSPPLRAGSAHLASQPEFLWPSGEQLGRDSEVSGPSVPMAGGGAAGREAGGREDG